MARAFDDLVAEAAVSWDEDTQAVHDAARAYFAAQARAQLALGEQVTALRAETGLTQTDLARAAGVPQPEVSRIERGTGNPTRETLTRLAEALHASLVFVPDHEISSRTQGVH